MAVLKGRAEHLTARTCTHCWVQTTAPLQGSSGIACNIAYALLPVIYITFPGAARRKRLDRITRGNTL